MKNIDSRSNYVWRSVQLYACHFQWRTECLSLKHLSVRFKLCEVLVLVWRLLHFVRTIIDVQLHKRLRFWYRDFHFQCIMLNNLLYRRLNHFFYTLLYFNLALFIYVVHIVPELSSVRLSGWSYMELVPITILKFIRGAHNCLVFLRNCLVFRPFKQVFASGQCFAMICWTLHQFNLYVLLNFINFEWIHFKVALSLHLPWIRVSLLPFEIEWDLLSNV